MTDLRTANYLKTAKHDIDQALRDLLTAKTKAAKQQDSEYGRLLTAIAELVNRGGKRLRPILTLLVYEGLGGNDRAAIMPAALSQELFHAFILMHDDIIDRDVRRWGGPNISGTYFESFAQTLPVREALHYAESWGLLAGDVCLQLSQETLLASSASLPRLRRAHRLMQQSLFTVVGGEVADVSHSLRPAKLSEQQILNLYAAKTASYTFGMPLGVGALLAGAKGSQIERLAVFAENVGIAFQIQDDLLGVFGDEQQTGKSNLGDIREGKQTLLMYYGRQLASEADGKRLQSYLGNPEFTAADLAVARQILRRCGAYQKTLAKAQDYTDQALVLLPDLGFSKLARQVLTELVTRNVSRRQ